MTTNSSGMKTRALEMLAGGIPQSAVANRLGVTESAISQMMEDPGFQQALEGKRLAISEKDASFDELLEETETTALERIAERIKFGNLQQSLQAFKVLNSARKRKDSAQPQAGQQGTSVYINMPTILVPQFVMNQKSEIVEVDGKTMISASPARLNEIVQEKTGVVLALNQDRNERAKQVLESAVRSVVQPTRRGTRQIPQADLVDLL